MRLSDARVIEVSLAAPARFADIFDRHIDAIRKFVVRRLGVSRSDDVVSEVFRAAFERRSTFDLTASSALPWLYGIASNLVRRDHRSSARRLATAKRAGGHGNVVGDPLVDLAERIDARADLRELSKALMSLSDDEREVLLLVAWEQLSPTEAAAVLGIAPETARTRLRRARQHVRGHLERNEPTTEVATDGH